MQAALYVRGKQGQGRGGARGRVELPSNVATKEIAPFPRYPPLHWGKAAWQDQRERERRVSLTEVAVSHRLKASEAHRRWMRRNRIHDSSFGGSSSDDDTEGGMYGQPSEAANALLYVGLGTVAIGLVISFVGTGEKGFKTLELRLIGPSLIGSGLLCCLVRIFLCVCPSPCLRRRHRHRARHKRKDAAAAAAAAAAATACASASAAACASAAAATHRADHHHHHHYHHHHRHRNSNAGGGGGGFFGGGGKEHHKATEDIALADQTSLLLKNNAKKSVSISTSPAVVAPSGSSAGRCSGGHAHDAIELEPSASCSASVSAAVTASTSAAAISSSAAAAAATSHRNSVVATTTLFLQNEKERATTTFGYKVPAINIPNFIASNSDDEERSRRRKLSQPLLHAPLPLESSSHLLDLEQLDSGSFDICSLDSGRSQEKEPEQIEASEARSIGSAQGRGRDKMIKPRAPTNARVPVTPRGPSGGRLNPDPEAHRLEEDLLLAAEVEAELGTPSPLASAAPVRARGPGEPPASVAAPETPAPTPAAPSLASPQHSDKDGLLQNEIVLSPAKLQQDIKD